MSAKWKEGRLTEAGLKALVPGSFRIKLPADSANMSIKINQKAVSLPVADGIFGSSIAGWGSVGADVFNQYKGNFVYEPYRQALCVFNGGTQRFLLFSVRL